jgi:hypothetical protein
MCIRDRENGPRLPFKVPKLFNLNSCHSKISDLYFRADMPKLGSKSANILLDTGAEGGNYIASQYAENCGLAIYSDKDGHLVRLANGSIVEANQYLYMSLIINLICKNTILTKYLLNNVKFYLINQLPIHLIVGLATIRQFSLTRVFHKYFEEHSPDLYSHITSSDAHEAVELISSARDMSVQQPTANTPWEQDKLLLRINSEGPRNKDIYPVNQYLPNDKVDADTHFLRMKLLAPLTLYNTYGLYEINNNNNNDTSKPNFELDDEGNYWVQTINDIIPFNLLTVTNEHYVLYNKSDFLTEEEDNDYADDRLEVYPPLDHTSTTKEPWQLVTLEGSETLIVKLVNLLKNPKYKRVFLETTSPIPASIRPMRFEVDEDQWFSDPYNRQPTRMQSLSRQYAIDKFLSKAIADGIIKPSSAPAWSQLFLTPKKNGDFRICLDYRNLNKVTKKIAWPIPRIDQMLNRIGSHRPNYFGVFDLTSGYYQCPIVAESQKYTTFSTSRGNYMWTRLPMGPSNAPAHFQREMTTTVFPNEMYKILELSLIHI